jgi:hypothetical protein
MPVIRGRRRSINVDVTVLDFFLPEWDRMTNGYSIHIDDIARLITSSNFGRGSSYATSCLEALFEVLQDFAGDDRSILAQVDTFLNNTLRHSVHKARHYFDTLSELALQTLSCELATFLVHWFQRRCRRDIRHEHPVHLNDWMTAVEQLRGLASGQQIDNAISSMYRQEHDVSPYYSRFDYDDPLDDHTVSYLPSYLGSDWNRGRRFQRWRPHNFSRPRTSPPYIYRPRFMAPAYEESRFIAPAYEEPRLLTPVTDHSWCDYQIDQLQMDQADLSDRVQNLEMNQMDMEMDMFMPRRVGPAPSPLGLLEY